MIIVLILILIDIYLITYERQIILQFHFIGLFMIGLASHGLGLVWLMDD